MNQEEHIRLELAFAIEVHCECRFFRKRNVDLRTGTKGVVVEEMRRVALDHMKICKKNISVHQISSTTFIECVEGGLPRST